MNDLFNIIYISLNQKCIIFYLFNIPEFTTTQLENQLPNPEKYTNTTITLPEYYFSITIQLNFFINF